MLSRKYKSSFGELVLPVNQVLQRLRVNADHLTLAGIIFGGLAGLAFARERLALAGVFLILAGVSDMLDGALARAAGEDTRFGSFIDSVADRFTEFLIFAGLAWLYRGEQTLFLVLAGMAGSFLVSYTRARAEALGVRCEVGLMERPERMILLIAGALTTLMLPVLWALAVLSLVTAVHRVLHVRRQLTGAPR